MQIKTILISAILLASCTKGVEVKIKGKVVSHVATSDGDGTVAYRTIIKCEDGVVRERFGFNFYAVPVDSTCTLVETIYK